MKIMMSGCLLGQNCKYSGENNKNENCIKLLEKHIVIPVCPEQMGGLPTPRGASEIQQGNGADVLSGKAKVVDENGIDETEGFLKGADETLKLFKMLDCELAILKARSPSCGKGKIYDGSFTGTLRDGNGATVELLLRNGISVLSEEDTENLLYE